MAVLRYGNNSHVELQFGDGVTPAELGTPVGTPLADVALATRAALEEPLDYPPLRQCTTPADHVVLALDPGAPQVAAVAAAVVQALVDADVDPDGITVLQRQADTPADNPCRLLPKPLRDRVKLQSHDPADRRQLAYLAASEAGQAILVNRALHEADVVLPIGCLHADSAAGYFGIHSSVFPAFSDAKTIQRFRSFASLGGRGNHKRDMIAEVNHVAWLLGVNFTVQMVPASGRHALHMLAGQSDAVRAQGRQLYHAAWSWPAARSSSLVVAAIEGDAAQQTWENLGRALAAAKHFVEADGAIVLCSELSASLGPAMKRMAQESSHRNALRRVGKERPADALPAAQLAKALERHKVYLLSRLDASLVEDLDIVPLAGPDEVVRLARQHASCTLLSNAPFVTAVKPTEP